MTNGKLKKANELRREIDSIQAMLNNSINANIQAVDFVNSKGSVSAATTDKNIIQKVKELIIELTTEKLENLQKEFDQL